MVEDLSSFQLGEIDASIKAYRRNGENRFFPTSGQLMAPIQAARKERARDAKLSNREIPKDLRPSMWWTQMPYLWKSGWRVEDIPKDHQAAFHARVAYKRRMNAEGWGEHDFYGLERKWADKQAQDHRHR